MAAGGEVGGGGEVGAVAGLGGFAGQADGEVGLAEAGRADQQDVGGGFEVAAGGQLGDEPGVDGGGGVVVEVLQGGRGGQGREAEPSGQAAGLVRGDLDREQPLERGGEGQVLGGCGVQDGGQRLGGVVQLQLGEVAAELLVEAGLRGRGRSAGPGWFSLLAWGSPDRRGGAAVRWSGCCGRARRRRSGRDRSTASPAGLAGLPAAARRASAAARAAGPGGMRCLRRCGAAGLAAVIAACSRARTWPWSRTMTPAPAGARACRAITVPAAVAMSRWLAPSRQAHDDRGPGELGCDAVAVAAEGHQCLRGDRARDRQGGRERHWRRRAQRLARRDRGDGRLAVRGRAQPDVPAAGAPGVQELLGLLGR